MLGAGVTSLATAGAGLTLIGLCSFPSVALLSTQLRESDPKMWEDEDGKATAEDSQNFNNMVPKAFIVLFSITGLGLSISLGVLSTLGERDGLFFENWLSVGAWALLNFQAICIASSRKPVAAYDLGLNLSLCCVILAAVLAFQDNKIAAYLLKHNPAVFAIHITEIVVIVALGYSGLSLKRRPDVYHDGQLVDRLYTESAWNRFNWAWPENVLRAAAKKNNLDLVDLPRPDHFTRAKTTTADWESRKFKSSLWRSIISAHKFGFAMQWFGTLTTAFLNFAPQWCVLQLLRILEQRSSRDPIGYDAWIWVVWIFVSVITQSWAESYVFWMSWASLSIPIRAQLSSLIFMKSMRRKDVKGAGKEKSPASHATDPLSAGHAGEASTSDQPQIEETADEEESLKKSKQSTVNLIGVDAKRVSDFAAFNNYFPGSLFKLIVSLAFLLNLLGWKALLAGFSTMLATTPVNIYFSKRYSAAQDKLMKVRDEKMEVVSEALQGIRQIKFSALEPQWEKKIGEVRERELGCIWSAFINDTMLIGCWVTSPVMLSAVALSVYAAVHSSLTPSVAFVSLGVFRALEVTLSVVPELTTDLLDAWVSVKRIGSYLEGAEIEKQTKDAEEITFDNATIAWPSDEKEADEEDRFVLQKVNVMFPKGELSVISGKTGSGKSMMLSAILGEVDILDGSISVPRAIPLEQRHDSKANKSDWILPGAIAFVAQIPWIENATIKENILFGLPFDEERYRKTVEVCALKKDIEMFTDGDNTEIGANGINLSGGQKWRITLARAIYSRAVVLVLDDIFSAVDAHVGRHIFEQCLNGELSVGRTRILVTHHVALCAPKTKYLVELGDGQVLHAGLLSDLEEAGTLQQIESHEQTGMVIQVDEDATAVNSEETSQADDETSGEPLSKIPSKSQARKFVEEEQREQGAIKRHVYATYLKDSGGWVFWTVAVLFFMFVQSLTVGRSWWLRIWTGTYEEESTQIQNESRAYIYSVNLQQTAFQKVMEPMVASEHGLGFYLGIYVLLAASGALLGTARYYYIFHGSIRASRKLFARLKFVVLRAPLRWLDTVPVGRVLNRFTADFHSVDTHLAYSLAFGFASFLNLVGVVVAGLFVSPIILLLAIILLLISVFYALRYLHGARPVKRLESTTKSPVFEQFGSALSGVTTIRSFDKAQVYIERMYKKLDDWTVASWHLWLFNRWMGWRMSVVGSFFASFVAILILLTPEMDSALAGFALAFALDFSGTVMWTIRHYANIELEMNAAERVVEYSELPTESLEGESPPAAWPTEGRVEVKDLHVSYAADLPPVLKGLTFSINRSERVGVVGRTGAGKSSLTLALFRFLEARSGSIYVDGLDISKIKLHDLRSRLAIIPQDPVLFSGTVRSNLDPFDDHTDAELFDSLQRVHLIMENETSPGTPVPDAPTEGGSATKKNINIFQDLASPISEGGLNLSQGQRQLLCLARAIVSRPKVMVLDEATSAVDMNTDALIQRSIREEFEDSTLVVIAHRLSTIADFDRILVLSDGKVAEFDTPKELWEMEDGKGIFRGMCEESGEKDRLKGICLGEEN